MRAKIRPWHLAAGLLVVCALILGSLYFWRSRTLATPTAMIGSLPRSGAILAFLDIAALRRAGILDLIAGSKATEDLEYQQFVDGTGFDYQRDLDSIAGSFSGPNAYLIVRGKFDWKKVSRYAASHGATCRNSVCRVSSSERRFMSYYPLRSDTMALAFSSNDSAVLDITPRLGGPVEPQKPDQPIWISVTGPALRDAPRLPPGAQSFVSPLESAESIVMSAGPAEDRLQVNINVLCASETAASDLVTKLEGATNMLRKMLERENKQPNPRDLSGMLAAGHFRRDNRRVVGQWPMHREFIEALASGSLD